ncbi:hypothetical protein PLICRDRAFT_45974 [Plicaturopsis crispa FD-325 SS-3]|uniref:Uncharacterized protein n=1 Tax=Plicaturopsis crispa FD-325 SS-3 TaxID=944288 RepID=A0A0C9T8P5_PLICR|nr:hypothetical protein PLICRDRAFT_45974 [Plicaturopsis crispa FD-325 SS-3]
MSDAFSQFSETRLRTYLSIILKMIREKATRSLFLRARTLDYSILHHATPSHCRLLVALCESFRFIPLVGSGDSSLGGHRPGLDRRFER